MCRSRDSACSRNERSPRVIWLGIEQGKTELTALAQRTLGELVTIGFIPEKRPFSAHLTIGRVKEPIPDARPILARPFASPAFPVSEMVLFRSFLKPTGPVYEALGRYPSPATSDRPPATQALALDNH